MRIRSRGGVGGGEKKGIRGFIKPYRAFTEALLAL